jgi:hypothetical protein
MAFQVSSNRALERELRRIVDHQLEVAITDLCDVGREWDDERIRHARRQAKKARAIMRLVRGGLEESSRHSIERLGLVNHLLGPLSDGPAVVDTLQHLVAKHPGALSRRTIAAMTRALEEREQRVDRQAQFERVVRRALHLLRMERRKTRQWRLKADDFEAIAPGLHKAVANARHAMARAVKHPTTEHYHAWRRRVKNHWLQIRVIGARCRDRLGRDLARLEALDALLGECHNYAVLRLTLTEEASVTRAEAAHCLRLIRHAEMELRAAAVTLGRDVYHETSRAYVQRLRGLWKAPRKTARAAQKGRPWRHAA